MLMYFNKLIYRDRETNRQTKHVCRLDTHINKEKLKTKIFEYHLDILSWLSRLITIQVQILNMKTELIGN